MTCFILSLNDDVNKELDLSNIETKPILTSLQLIQKMKGKGISFSLVSEEEAEKYLFNVNNFLRTASYRKNFQKNQKGANKGKYSNLDFAYLKELSTIDMHFRMEVIHLCIDIEHDLKVKILQEVETDSKIDGYSIVKEFLANNEKILKKIAANCSSPFTCDLIKKYFTIEEQKDPNTNKKVNNISKYDDCPIWVFLELITFGDLIYFYKFFYEQNGIEPVISNSLLHLVKNLRNGCAHNNCILANLSANTSRAPQEISSLVSSIKGISKSQRQKKLTCRPILEFVTLLYIYDKIVSEKVKKKGFEKLHSLFSNRMLRNKSYFLNNELVKSTYNFSAKILSFFLEMNKI